MSVEGWEEVILDEEIAELLRVAIREKFESAPADDSELDLELVDIAIERSVVLCFFFLFCPMKLTEAFSTAPATWLYLLHTQVLKTTHPWL